MFDVGDAIRGALAARRLINFPPSMDEKRSLFDFFPVHVVPSLLLCDEEREIDFLDVVD